MTARKKCKRATQRKSSRLAKKPRNVYRYVTKDIEENVSSEDERMSDFIKDSESSDSEDSDLSDSDVSEKMTLRDTRRSMATRRNVRASTRKARRSYGEDSTSGEDSNESSESSNSSRSSSQSSEDEDSGPSSKEKKQSKDSTRYGKKGAAKYSDEEVSGLSNSAKKRKKSTQVESSDEDQKKVRKRIVTPADDESDSADEHHSTKKSVMDKDEEPAVTTTQRGKSESVSEGDKKNEDESASVKTSNGEKNESTSTSDDKKHPTGTDTASDENKPTKDGPAREESQETKKDPNPDDNAKCEDAGSSDATHTANCQRNGTSEEKSLQAVDSSDENKAKIPSVKSDPDNVQVESKLKKNKSPKAERSPSKHGERQKALKKLMKQRKKKQGGDQSTSASEEEEEEEEEEDVEDNRVSEDDFIVSDEEEEEEIDDQLHVLKDHRTEETKRSEVQKAKLQSLMELMLCAHLQEDPGEYIRTARFNREIPKETHNDIAAVTDRLESAINLVFSGAWKKNYKEAIQQHPKFSNYSVNSRRDCEACGRYDHPSSQGINFSGKPYNKETFATEDFGNYAKSFSVGRFCHERSEIYHSLYHFKHKLFHSCGAQVNKACDFFRKKGDGDPDIDRVINRCMKNELWIHKMFSHMENILEEAHNYTTDKKYSAGVAQLLG